MAGRIWGLGYEAGRHEANRAAEKLRALRPRRIPAFAGSALKRRRTDANGTDLAKHPEWAVGFWDGFLDRAEELHRLPKPA